MLIVGVVPILTGQIDWANYSPLVPLAAAYAPEPGSWNIAGWTLVLGGMFIAAWSTYGFETAVCYTKRVQEPGHRHLQGDLLFGPALPAALHPGALHLPGRARPQRHAGHPDRRRFRRCRRHGRHGRRRRLHQEHHGDADDPGAAALHHDGDGRLVAHALPGLGRRLAAALSRATSTRMARRRAPCGPISSST